MKTRKIMAMIMAVALSALCLGMVSGCAQPANQEDNAAKNRAYISQANTMMQQLNADLEPFTAAVAAEDVVTMEQAAANVYRDFAAFEKVTPPADMKDIHAEYSAGCEDLKQAMQAYVALFKDAADTDVSDLNEKLADVQKQYDSGIAHLQAGDKKMTELPGATPSSSSSAESGSSTESGGDSSSASESESSSAAEESSSSSQG